MINGGAMAIPNNSIQKERNIKDCGELFIQDCLKVGLGTDHVELLQTIVDRAMDSKISTRIIVVWRTFCA